MPEIYLMGTSSIDDPIFANLIRKPVFDLFNKLPISNAVLFVVESRSYTPNSSVPAPCLRIEGSREELDEVLISVGNHFVTNETIDISIVNGFGTKVSRTAGKVFEPDCLNPPPPPPHKHSMMESVIKDSVIGGQGPQ